MMTNNEHALGIELRKRTLFIDQKKNLVLKCKLKAFRNQIKSLLMMMKAMRSSMM